MELKPKDIRIGNIIHSPDTDKWVIVEMNHLIYIDNMDRGALKGRAYIAEPLTEEWLLKFGAIKSQDILYFSVAELKTEIHFEFFRKECVTKLYGIGTEYYFKQLKYVHQLQNLYYALTGEELKVRETISH